MGFASSGGSARAGATSNMPQVGANAVSYTDVNLPSATTYCYRITAFNSVGSSGYSNENCATTLSGYVCLDGKPGRVRQRYDHQLSCGHQLQFRLH